jgi:hypothetical protein
MMTDPQKLPHLLRLLDDESEVVRQSVINELASYGPDLEQELTRLRISPTDRQKELIRELLQDSARARLRSEWASWRVLPEATEKLEAGVRHLSEYLDGFTPGSHLADRLSQLSDEFRRVHDSHDALALARFLFQEKGFKGAEQDYDNPQNSNLFYILNHRRGIPISLTVLFILIGHRLGMSIEGLNFPGHFLARASVGTSSVIIDCFNGGRFVEESHFTKQVADNPLASVEMDDLKSTPSIILGRMIRNLISAFEKLNDATQVTFFTELLEPLTQADEETD